MEAATFDTSLGAYRAGKLAVTTELTEDLLAEAFLRLKKDKLAETVWYEGVPSVSNYLKNCTEPDCINLGGFVDRTGSADPRKPQGFDFVGMAWVYHQQLMSNHMRKAEVGFAFFRHAATSRQKIQVGRIMTQALFERFNIDVIFGSTPDENQGALRYAKAVGFEISAQIPNAICWEGALSSVRISSLTKANWQKQTGRLDLDAFAADQAMEAAA